MTKVRHNKEAEGALANSPSPTFTSEIAEINSERSHSDRAFLLRDLQRKLAYSFQDSSLLELALTHSSVAYETQLERKSQTDNEQLEFLGDAVLGLAVTEYLFRAYPEFSEGMLTRLRAQLVSRQNLGRLGQRLDIGRYLKLGKGEEKSGGRRKTAILANAVEAVIAAVYLDGGPPETARLVREWLCDDKLEAMAAAARAGEGVGDHKSSLQEYFQAHNLGQPQYQVTSETGPDHRKSFVIAVKLVESDGGERILASAAGSRKKHAEQEAARLALACLHSVTPDATKDFA